jgi:N-acetylneuraminic acid mutarotase
MDSRYSHSAIVYTNCVYIFAGFSVRDNVLTDSIIRFSPETNEWEYIDVAGKVPPKRKGHAAAAVKNNMYIFGGVDESDKLLNDMWRFNFGS